MDISKSRPDTDDTLDLHKVEPPRSESRGDNRGRKPVPGSGVVEGSGAGAGGGGNPEEIDDDAAGGGGEPVGRNHQHG
jgi:hypothetical protein